MSIAKMFVTLLHIPLLGQTLLQQDFWQKLLKIKYFWEHRFSRIKPDYWHVNL